MFYSFITWVSGDWVLQIQTKSNKLEPSWFFHVLNSFWHANTMLKGYLKLAVVEGSLKIMWQIGHIGNQMKYLEVIALILPFAFVFFLLLRQVSSSSFTGKQNKLSQAKTAMDSFKFKHKQIRGGNGTLIKLFVITLRSKIDTEKMWENCAFFFNAVCRQAAVAKKDVEYGTADYKGF